jgi:hypothetical protein
LFNFIQGENDWTVHQEEEEENYSDKGKQTKRKEFEKPNNLLPRGSTSEEKSRRNRFTTRISKE